MKYILHHHNLFILELSIASYMKRIEIIRDNLVLKDKIIGFLEGEVKSHGTSGRVSCPRRFIGKKAYLVIVK
jgi:putative transposon-encoded protein